MFVLHPQTGLQGFGQGYLLQLSLRLVTSIPKLVRAPRRLLPLLTSETNIQAGLFIGSFTSLFKVSLKPRLKKMDEWFDKSLYMSRLMSVHDRWWNVTVVGWWSSLAPLTVLSVGQGTCCAGRWWHGEDRAGHGTVAGAIAALSMYFYSAPSLALYIMWKVVEVSCWENWLGFCHGNIQSVNELCMKQWLTGRIRLMQCSAVYFKGLLWNILHTFHSLEHIWKWMQSWLFAADPWVSGIPLCLVHWVPVSRGSCGAALHETFLLEVPAQAHMGKVSRKVHPPWSFLLIFSILFSSKDFSVEFYCVDSEDVFIW